MESLSRGDQSAVRIGDAERSSCVQELMEHHALGRLTLVEFDQRQTAALAAVTAADLSLLLVDLPSSTAGARADGPGPGPGQTPKSLRDRNLGQWTTALAAFATTGLAVATIDVVSDEREFTVAAAVAGLGFLGHYVLSRRSSTDC